jgi:D-alanyl-D-alanine carboxypeptidase
VPGKYTYSNTNSTLLGLIIEHITGNTAESEIRRRILTPLKLDSTYLEGFKEDPTTRLPRRYHYNNLAFRTNAGVSKHFPEVKPGLIDVSTSNLQVSWLAGGYLSTSTDLVHFAMAIRDGTLLSSESLKIMQTWQPAGNAEVGHGIFRIDLGGDVGKVFTHNGSVLGFSGAFWWSEKGDCAIAILANLGTVHAGDVLGGFSPALRWEPAPREFPDLAIRLASEDEKESIA